MTKVYYVILIRHVICSNESSVVLGVRDSRQYSTMWRLRSDVTVQQPEVLNIIFVSMLGALVWNINCTEVSSTGVEVLFRVIR